MSLSTDVSPLPCVTPSLECDVAGGVADSAARPLSGTLATPVSEDCERSKRGSLILKERYDLLDQLDEGSTATVWRALDNKTNELVALKIANKFATVGTLSVFFRAEAKILQKLNHPNIVKVHDFTNQYVSMELMSSCLFDYIIQNKNLQTGVLLNLFSQILQAVAYIHSKGFCHRDIKLENILLNRSCSTAKLADFGFATKSNHKRIEGVYPGSPDYLSPEVALQVAYDGMAYDVWALGIMLFSMSSRKFPFSKPNEPNEVIIERIKVFSSFESIDTGAFPEEILALLKRMIVKDPSLRPTVAQLLEDPILAPYIVKEDTLEPTRKARIAALFSSSLRTISVGLTSRFGGIRDTVSSR